jgi:hypothetical protein
MLEREDVMKNCGSMAAVVLAATCFATCVVAGAGDEKKNRPAELQAYWAVQSVTVDGKEDGGEKGSYLIIRADGTYRSVKKGRKPEGSWSVDADNKLVLKVGERVIMRSDWQRDGDRLTLSFEDRGAKVQIKYSKAVLDKEPKAPDED